MIQKMLDKNYFELPGVSNSLLSKLAKCPAGMNIQTETTPAMLTGTLAHAMILEGTEVFHSRFAVAPECDRRTKEGKAVYQSFCEANGGKTVITLDQLQAVAGMAASVASHPSACELLQDGEPEQAITWEQDGTPCKSKADWLSSTALIDLKSCQDSSYPVFSKTIFNSGYARQMAMYWNGLKANGVFPANIIIIAVENKAPFTTNVYRLDDDVLEYGEGEFLRLLKLYESVKDMEVLPSYTYAGIANIRLPMWLREAE